jgi:para-nitrobenzyl esterase
MAWPCFAASPFAAPPVGKLRFEGPAPAESWDGVLEADVFGPPPPRVGPSSPASAAASLTRHDPTDWLTVNVWTPDTANRELPVMVYIYGGAYRFGHSGGPSIDRRVLASSGVVVVTGNHRVGMDGYASLHGAPDNRAPLDQVALLRWVQENIAAFGGDPARITVFGESAGAGAVANLVIPPRREGCSAPRLCRACRARTSPGGWRGTSPPSW